MVVIFVYGGAFTTCEYISIRIRSGVTVSSILYIFVGLGIVVDCECRFSCGIGFGGFGDGGLWFGGAVGVERGEGLVGWK